MLRLSGEGQIELGGKTHPVVFKNATLALFLEKHNDSYKEFYLMLKQLLERDVPVNKLTDLVHASLVYGYKSQGKTFTSDRETVLDWVMEADEAIIGEFARLVFASLPPMTQNEEDNAGNSEGEQKKT